MKIFLIALFSFIISICSPVIASGSTEDASDGPAKRPKTALVSNVDLSEIPDEIKLHILSHISKPVDLLSIMLVSKEWLMMVQASLKTRMLDVSKKSLEGKEFQAPASETLLHLKLSNIPLTNDHMSKFATNINLRTLSLQWCNLKNFNDYNALRSFQKLSKLDLSENMIDDEGAIALASVLNNLSSLATVDLNHNSISDNGATAIVAKLKKNTLTFLDLSHNRIKKAGAVVIAALLTKSTTLTLLDLSYNPLDTLGTQAIAAALRTNTSCKALHLLNSNIDDDGANWIADMLKENTTLTLLDLGQNRIKNEGAIEIADALQYNTTLTTLILEDNPFGKDGKKALEEAKSDHLEIDYGR